MALSHDIQLKSGNSSCPTTPATAVPDLPEAPSVKPTKGPDLPGRDRDKPQRVWSVCGLRAPVDNKKGL